MPKKIQFSFSIEGKPDQEITLGAFFYDKSGKLLEQAAITKNSFVLNAPDDATLTSGKVLIAPVDPKVPIDISLEDLLKKNPFQITLPVRISEKIQIGPIIETWWRNWLMCSCTVKGKIFNGNCTGNQGIEGARVTIYEVDAFPFIIMRIPDLEIFKIRDKIWEEIQFPGPVPGPSPLINRFAMQPGKISLHFNDALKIADIADSKFSNIKLNAAPLLSNLKDFMPKENLSNFFSQSPLLIKDYLSKNFKFFVPVICKWWYRFITKSSLGTVVTGADGSFSKTIKYFCFGDVPDLYFEVEYLIDGVWTKVYQPTVACNTHWDYKCGTEISIFVKDDRIRCKPVDNGYQQKEIVFRSIGNSCIVTNVKQDTPLQGLPYDLSKTTPVHDGNIFDGNPFGGTLVPLVDFGAKLCDAIDGGQNYWYRWMRRKAGELTYKPIDAPMSVQYEVKHFDAGGNLVGKDYPFYQYGPDARGLYKILRRHIPASEGGYEIVGGYGASFKATANFDTTALAIRNPVTNVVTDWNDGVYDLMFELYDNAGNIVNNWEAQSVQFFVMKKLNPATPGAIETTETNPAVISQYKVLNGVNTAGFNMKLFIDNNPAEAAVFEAWVDTPGNTGGECGFIYYNALNTPPDKNKAVNLKFHAWQKNKFANFGFGVIKGNNSVNFSASGKVDVPSCTLSRNTGPVITQNVGTFNNNGTGDFTGTGVTVGELTGTCNSAAFSQSVGVSATAHNGTYWITNYVSDTKAFALDTQ